MIEFRAVTYAYAGEGAERPALGGVSLSIAAGEHVAVLGANGSGKSTLARLANGILLADSGCVAVDGMRTDDPASIRELRQRVGIVFQRPDDQIVATSVEDEVAFGPENLGLDRAALRSRVDEALAAVGLTGLERREPHLLSGGQKQRLAIAGALALRPAYLVLDEPTSMLDPQGRDEVLGIIEKLVATGTGVLHITHDLGDVVSADRALVLDRGVVTFEGTVAALLGEEGLLERSGLELPPLAVLAAELRLRGVDVPADALTPQSIAEALRC